MVFPVGLDLCIFHCTELEEVGRAVLLMVKLLGVGEPQPILHCLAVLHSHEVVVPGARVGHHVEAHEPVRKKHLHLLVVSWQVPVRVGAVVLVLAAPLVALWSELVGRERARTRRKGARDEDATLAVPGLVSLEQLGMRGHVLRAHLGQLVGLRVHPPERLEVAQVLVLREGRRQVNVLVVAPLRRHDHAPDLLHLWVVRRAHAVEVARYLGSEVRDADELLQDVLGHDVGVPSLTDVVADNVDVVHAEVKVGGADSAHPPVRL
mmetsp:Transcript_21771/g.52020  ORF Transcript_21771/g.52020 Transcript_21771/m.52020 type:complete len:264 (-) Transcript_21771:6449-7240(-)